MGGEADAVVAARLRVRKICDCLGGRSSLGFQALVHVIGEGMTVSAWSLGERDAPWRLNNDSAMSVFKCTLAALEGFYRARPEAPKSAG